MTRFVKLLALPAVAALTVAGCATGAVDGAAAGVGDAARVVVDARGATVPAATVYLVPRSGARIRLGLVNSGERQVFPVDRVDFGRYRLLAEAGADELVSREFSFRGGEAVEWRVDLNQVTYLGETEQR